MILLGIHCLSLKLNYIMQFELWEGFWPPPNFVPFTTENQLTFPWEFHLPTSFFYERKDFLKLTIFLYSLLCSVKRWGLISNCITSIEVNICYICRRFCMLCLFFKELELLGLVPRLFNSYSLFLSPFGFLALSCC